MLVVVFVFEGIQLLDVTGPIDVLAEGARQAGLAHSYRFLFASLGGGAVSASNGMRLAADCSLAEIPGEIDTLLLAGGANQTDVPAAAGITSWLVPHARAVRRLCAVCGGAFLLGQAGLLDGKNVTTHWKNAAQLARRFPRAMVQPDRLMLWDGTIYTSGGATAGMDLALRLLEEDFGKEISAKVAREFVLLPRRDRGQTQFTEPRARPRRDGTLIEDIRKWVDAHLDKPLTTQQLALQAGMSAANLQEMFVRHMQMQPEEYILEARIREARRLLETSQESLSSIARRCGLGNVVDMRRSFHRRTGMSPRAYRLHARAPASRT